MYTMATDNFDGYTHVDKLKLKKALKEGTTEEEIKEAYVAWSKTYEKVNINFSFIKPVSRKTHKYEFEPSYKPCEFPSEIVMQAWAYGKEKFRGAERHVPDFFGLCPTSPEKIVYGTH